MNFNISFEGEAEDQLLALDKSIRYRMLKRIKKMENELPGRHLKHGLQFFVEDVGQYRLVYKCLKNNKIIYFIGLHKEYEKWFRPAK
ncbi:MAG: hypothetical protein KGH54_03275 [Candidatus Micrarchaeota archaeon]|nr:hypothetical protein [Candidatus Micrarchaeota archaeon]